MIIDTFLYNGELDILKIRLGELAPLVDRFIIVEGNRTFQNTPKIPYFLEHMYRIDPALVSRIHCHAVLDWPENLNPWQQERHLRNAIGTALDGYSLADTDIIMASDCDEIPSRDSVREGARLARNGGVWAVEAYTYSMWLNCKSTEKSLYTRIANYATLKQIGSTDRLRRVGDHSEWFHGYSPLPLAGTLKHGGWHFTYQGGPWEIQRKLRSYAHTEYSESPYTDIGYIMDCMAAPKDLFGRNFEYKFVPVDTRLPEYVVDHREELAPLIWHELFDWKMVKRFRPLKDKDA